MKKIRTTAASAIILSALLADSHAQTTCRWDGTNNNRWINPFNWNNGDPTASDTAILSSNSSRRGIDLSASGTEASSANRSVDLINFQANSANQLNINGNTVDWHLRWGTLAANTIHWRSFTSTTVMVDVDLNPSSLMTFEGGYTGGTPILHMFGDIDGTADVNIDTTGGEVHIFSPLTYDGRFNLVDGTLVLKHADAIKNARVRFNGNGMLTIDDLDANIGSLVGNGTLALPNNRTITVGFRNLPDSFPGSLSGGGDLVKTGTGTWTMKGANTHNGTTTISQGDIILEDGGTLENSAVNVTSGTSLTCNSASALGNLYGPGTVNVNADLSVGSVGFPAVIYNGELNGTGTLTFTDGVRDINGTSGDFSGDVNFNGGNAQPAGLRFQNSLVIINADEAFDLKAATTVKSLAGSGDLILDYDLTLAGSGGGVEYSGDLSGTSALTKSGSGLWIFNGNKTGNGLTTISNGILAGNNSFAGDLTINSGATISPGNSAGTTVVSGDMDLTGSYSCELDGTESDRLEVTGNLDLSGGSALNLAEAGSGATEDTYIIATYGSLTGTFSTVTGIFTYPYYIDYAYDDGISTNNIAVVFDTVAPTATSVIPSTTGPTNASSVTFTVTFSEDVSGFNNVNDLIVGTTGTAAWTFNSITPVNASTYDVVLDGLSGDGEITLTIATYSDVQDILGNALESSVTSAAVTLDNNGPVITSIYSTVDPLIDDDRLFIRVEVDEEMLGFDALSDLVLTTDGTITYSDMVIIGYNGSSYYTVRIRGLEGDGNLSLDVVSPGDITDLLGNPLANDPSPSSTVINRSAPEATITAITSSPSNTTTAEFSVQFTEDIVALTLSDLDVQFDGTSFGSPTIGGSGSSWSVTVPSIVGDGTVSLDISASNTIEDLHGALLGNDPAPANVVIDQAGPTASLSAITPSPTNASTVEFSITFDQDIQALAPADLDISFTGGTFGSPVISGSDDTWTVTLPSVDGDGTLEIDIASPNNIQNDDGLPLENDPSPASVEIDQTGPTVTLATVTSSATELSTLQFSVSFDEQVPPLSLSDIEVSFPGGTHDTPVIGGSGNSWIVTVSNVSGNGHLTLDISDANSITDLLGNPLENDPSPASVFVGPTPIHYVSHSGSNTHPYDTWATAANNLQDVLALVEDGDQIWVATGTYHPDEGIGLTPGDVSLSFAIPAGIEIYGGFPADGGDGTFSARVLSVYPTYLSGDLGLPDDRTDNSNHVVTAIGADDAILDGLYIMDGTADTSATEPDNLGGGLLILANTNPIQIRNCSFVNNTAQGGGAVMIDQGGSVMMKNCMLSGNMAEAAGGALIVFQGTLLMENCSVQGNHATDFSGGILIGTGTGTADVTIRNSILWGNTDNNPNDTTTGSFVAFANYTLSISNSIAEHIDWSATGGFDGTDPANDPQFVEPLNPSTAPNDGSDLRLQNTSPFIDAGSAEVIPTTTDLIGNARIIGAAVDLGAYEGGVTLSPPVIVVNGDLLVYLLQNEIWTDPGAYALDAEDGTIGVTVGGDTVDTSVVGNYFITYDAVDSDGLSASQVTREVRVLNFQYNLWAFVRGLTDDFGSSGNPYGDPDGDGLKNYEEFALDEDPLSAAAAGKSRVEMVTNEVESYLCYTFPVLDGASFTGENSKTANSQDIIYTISGNENLTSPWDSTVQEVLPAKSDGLPALTPGWSYRTFRLTAPSATKGFLDLEIVEDL